MIEVSFEHFKGFFIFNQCKKSSDLSLDSSTNRVKVANYNDNKNHINHQLQRCQESKVQSTKMIVHSHLGLDLIFGKRLQIHNKTNHSYSPVSLKTYHFIHARALN